MHMAIYNSFIDNCQNLEATKMSFSTYMDKYTVVNKDNSILLSNDNKRAHKIGKDLKESSMYITEWKKPIWKGYVLYDSNIMTFGKRENYRDNKKRLVFSSGGVGIEINMNSREDF